MADFNMHLLGLDIFGHTRCPCCNLPRQQRPGEACSRGRRLWAALDSRDLLVINGCNRLQGYTCHMTSMQGQPVLTMVDYLIVNHEALHYVSSVLILDRPPRCNSKNFHSHLLLKLRCTVPRVPMLPSHAVTYRWVPGVE